jgi:hypothetical protein
MNEPKSAGRTATFSAAASEPVTIDVDVHGAEPVTIRLELDSMCACVSHTASKPGSYTYTDPRFPINKYGA